MMPLWSRVQVQPLPRAAGMEPLLPPKEARFQDRKTLVLDLDETLVGGSEIWQSKCPKISNEVLKASYN